MLDKKINLLVCDVDGVLTDGGMYYDTYGNEWKKFNTRDGKGIELLRGTGVKIMFLTSEDTNIVKYRAEKLKIDYCFVGIKDKNELLLKFFVEHKEHSFKQTAYIGDDVNDLAPLKAVFLSAAPADAVLENKKAANYICMKNGGQGCVREICDLIIRINETTK